jgi:hypothetical protein
LLLRRVRGGRPAAGGPWFNRHRSRVRLRVNSKDQQKRGADQKDQKEHDAKSGDEATDRDVAIAASALNRMLDLGHPEYVRIA